MSYDKKGKRGNKSMSDMILFDLDGTLTDSGPGITRCVQYALASFGIEEPDLEKLNCYVGPPLLESFMNFAGLGCEEAQQAITKYRERYEAEGIFENEVYEGIPEVLAYLKEKGKILAVASSKTGKNTWSRSWSISKSESILP